MTKYAEIFTDNFPQVKVVFTGEAPSPENFTNYLDELKHIYAQKQNLVILFDATKALMPGTTYQKMQADWIKENLELMKSYCLGTAYIVPNLLIRNVLKAIFKFQKQPVPYVVCAQVTEAELWLTNQLQKSQKI